MEHQGKRRGRKSSLEAIEDKLEKSKNRVIAAKKELQEAESEHSRLLAERDALRKDKLYKLILKSGKTYEEIVEFLESEPEDGD